MEGAVEDGTGENSSPGIKPSGEVVGTLTVVWPSVLGKKSQALGFSMNKLVLRIGKNSGAYGFNFEGVITRGPLPLDIELLSVLLDHDEHGGR